MSTEDPRRCPETYKRHGGPLLGDRIVECHLPAGHPGEHEEPGTRVTWWGEHTPGRGLERIRKEMPGMVPELTDEDLAKADAIIGAAGGASDKAELTVRASTRTHWHACNSNSGCASIGDDLDAAYARGISEGIRQAFTGDPYMVLIEEAHERGISEGRRQATAEHEAALLEEIAERDLNAEWGDKFAYLIGEYLGIDPGEHSSMNNPWAVAYEALREVKAAEAGRGRRATEGWDRHLRWHTAAGQTTELIEPNVAAYVNMQRRLERQYEYAPGELQCRLVGPWEHAPEQPAAEGEALGVTDQQRLPDVDWLIERGLAMPKGYYEVHLTDAGIAKLAEQPEDGTQ